MPDRRQGWKEGGKYIVDDRGGAEGELIDEMQMQRSENGCTSERKPF